ncbi:MAG: hypothetical protein II435_01940 [Bacteroidales bacterium]|nr:hypothetical protein [Bacteroidales bacterium]
MTRLMTLFSALLLAFVAFAQTPEEIFARMEAEIDKHEKDGVVMTVDVRIPLLGTMSSKVYSLDDKMRVEAKMMGVQIITWADGVTEWIYNSKTDEVEIKKVDPKDNDPEGDVGMFEGLTDDYDITLKKETADAWFFVCKKSKRNTDEDAPKTIDLAIAKGTYYPVSLKATVSGVTMTLHDIAFGVTEKQVTFNPKDYPTAKIVDKRK